MKIGIIVAMSKELNLLVPLLENSSKKEIDGFTFHCGTIGKNTVTAMQCGIGKVNAAMGALTLINNFDPDLVINTGVAGGADKSVNVMDIVVGAQIAYHDVYCGPESEYGAVQGLPLYYKSAQSIVDAIPADDTVHVGLICSGDRFIESIDEVNAIKSHFPQALAVDMESAAIAQVCTVRGAEFFSLRVISDSPGASHNNTAQYENFWEAAPAHTFSMLKSLLLKLE